MSVPKGQLFCRCLKVGKYNAEGGEEGGREGGREGGSAPIEILRQYLDHGGWFELKKKTFLDIEVITYVPAMCPQAEGAPGRGIVEDMCYEIRRGGSD